MRPIPVDVPVVFLMKKSQRPSMGIQSEQVQRRRVAYDAGQEPWREGLVLHLRSCFYHSLDIKRSLLLGAKQAPQSQWTKACSLQPQQEPFTTIMVRRLPAEMTTSELVNMIGALAPGRARVGCLRLIAFPNTQMPSILGRGHQDTLTYLRTPSLQQELSAEQRLL